MSEGGGECTYHLGVKDDGSVVGITESEYTETFLYLDEIARSNNYTITSIYEKETVDYKKVYELLIREQNPNKYIDIKVAVAGNVDAGKSSLLGVLTSGHLDDGRGKARTAILNYPHEIATGRTSSIAHHILGFDVKGDTVNSDRLGKMTWPEIVRKSEKVINFSDLCGHEKYLKTTILGISSTFPDLCFIIVGANMGLTRMTKEHIFLCLTLKIPFVIIITKMDIIKYRKNVYDETMNTLHTLLKMPSIRRAPYKIKTTDDVLLCAEKIYHDTLTPIFHVSNVTGEGVQDLKMFLNLLKKRKREYHCDDPVEYHIDTIFKNIKGVGVVVCGNLITGTIKVGDKLLIGPDNGKFEPVLVRSLQCKRVPIDKVDFATYVCIGLRNVDKDKIRKGHVIVSPTANPSATTDFEAEIKVLKSHSTTVREGYEPILHTCSIRQSATLVKVLRKDSDRNEEGKEHILRVGDKGVVLFRFKYRPEFMKVGYRLFLSEGKTKAVGEVTKIC
ncbi:GTP-binding protein [Pirellulaceae bacterium]|nr:GTP-binding protein [Pirellulaceae bacterium]